MTSLFWEGETSPASSHTSTSLRRGPLANEPEPRIMFRFASRTFANAGARMANLTGGFTQPRMAVASAAVATGAIGYYGMQNECLKIEIDDATAKKLLAALQPKQATGPRYNTLLPSPPNAAVKCCVVEFNVPGAKNGGSDKGPNGNRIDSIPIANGVIKAGGACEILKYFDHKHAEFAKAIGKYDALSTVAPLQTPRSLFPPSPPPSHPSHVRDCSRLVFFSRVPSQSCV
jgi:hypothetical protein